MTDGKYSYWLDQHSSDPSSFYEEFLDALYNQDEINLDSFVSCVKVIDYLLKTLDQDLDDDSRHFKRVVSPSASEEETQILETIDACMEILEETPELKNEAATRKLVNLRDDTGEWFEEIIVFLAESSVIPEDLFPWFLSRNQKPFSFDGDLFNSSRSGRSGLAINVNTSVEVLRELSTDSNWEILWRLALNTASPDDVLQKLIGIEDEMSDVIRACVAMNKSCSITTLTSLVEGNSADIRTLASRNPNATSELVARANELGVTKTPFKNWGSGLAWLFHR
jgi:hypothetical protein